MSQLAPHPVFWVLRFQRQPKTLSGNTWSLTTFGHWQVKSLNWSEINSFSYLTIYLLFLNRPRFLIYVSIYVSNACVFKLCCRCNWTRVNVFVIINCLAWKQLYCAVKVAVIWFLFCRAWVCHHSAEVCCSVPGHDWQTSKCGAGCAALQTGGGIPGRGERLHPLSFH